MSDKKTFEVRAYGWTYKCEVRTGRYPNAPEGGDMAVMLVDPDTGEMQCKLSVNLVDDLSHHEGQCFWAKTWSENEAFRQPALDSGLFEDLGERMATGHVQAELWKLVEPPPEG